MSTTFYELTDRPLESRLAQAREIVDLRRRLEKAESQLRARREWIARARAQSELVELPAGPMVLVPYWFMRDEL